MNAIGRRMVQASPDARTASSVRVIYLVIALSGSPVPAELPLALTVDFAAIEGKPAQWNAFARRLPAASVPADLTSVLLGVATFAGPVLLAVGSQEPFDRSWLPGGPWRSRSVASD